MIPNRQDEGANLLAAYDRLANDPGFHAHRAQFWDHCLGLPPRVAVRFLLRECRGVDVLRIADIGCGYGPDLDLLPRLVREADFEGRVDAIGCDLSPTMVARAQEGGRRVLQGDFRDLVDELGPAQLVWANMSLIHLPLGELADAIRALCAIAAAGGVVAVGFKFAQEDREFVDPPDERTPVERRTTLLSIETLNTTLQAGGVGQWLYSLQVPTVDPDAPYSYAWTYHKVNP